MGGKSGLEKILPHLLTNGGRKKLIEAGNGMHKPAELELRLFIASKRCIIAAEIALKMGYYKDARANYRHALENLEEYGDFEGCLNLTTTLVGKFYQGFKGLHETYRQCCEYLSASKHHD